MKYMFNTSK